MNSKLRVGMAIFLALSLIGQTFCASFAVKKTPTSTGVEWSIVNPPTLIDKEFKIPNVWTLKVKTHPLFEDLPQPVHPVIQVMNQYQEVEFIPNPAYFDFKGKVVQFDEPHTANFIEQMFPYQTLETLKKQTGSSQHFRNGVQTFLSFCKTIPAVLMITVICFPLIPYVIEEEVVRPARTRKKTLLRKKAQLELTQSIQLIQNFQVMDERLKSLQQTYERGSEPIPHAIYRVLPSVQQYEVDYTNKKIIRKFTPTQISFYFSLKKPFSVTTFKTLFPSPFREEILFRPDGYYFPLSNTPETPSQKKLTSCRLSSNKGSLDHWELVCSYQSEFSSSVKK